MKKFIQYKWLLLAIIIALVLRFVDYDNNPRALYGDELTMVYDTYSLINTGKDQLGNVLPITFEMGAGRPAGYVYGSIPFVFLFGPNALGVRFLSILSGVLLVVVVFLLGRKIVNKDIGLVAAYLMAISPWAISLSRAGFEANFALLLATTGTLCLLFVKEKPVMLLGWVICWGLAIHTYPTYKLLLPIFGVGLMVYVGVKNVFRTKNRLIVFISAILLTALLSITVYQFVFSGSESRFLSINVFSDETIGRNIVEKVNIDRERSDFPKIIRPFVHNKYFEYASVLVQSYLSNLSWKFLFLSGDGNPRHNPAEFGGFYLIEAITIFIGMIGLWVKRKKEFLLLLFWILISPLAAALLGVPHFLRSSFMIVPFVIYSSVGLNLIWWHRSNFSKFIKLFIVFGFICGIFCFFVYLFVVSPNKSEEFWSYSARLASQRAINEKMNYKYIILSDRIDNIEYAYPVYAKIDPSIVIGQNMQKTTLKGLEFKKIDNVYIGRLPESGYEEFLTNLDGNVLFIGAMNENKEVYLPEHITDKKGKELLMLKGFE
jgi:4-amino-4-deoxy-L-arabinose transferase-like glycosyltransferase